MKKHTDTAPVWVWSSTLGWVVAEYTAVREIKPAGGYEFVVNDYYITHLGEGKRKSCAVDVLSQAYSLYRWTRNNARLCIAMGVRLSEVDEAALVGFQQWRIARVPARNPKIF